MRNLKANRSHCSGKFTCTLLSSGQAQIALDQARSRKNSRGNNSNRASRRIPITGWRIAIGSEQPGLHNPGFGKHSLPICSKNIST